MSVVELPSSNGHGSTADRARQVWRPGMADAELAEKLGVPVRTASYHGKKLRDETGNKVADPVAKPFKSASKVPAQKHRVQPVRGKGPVGSLAGMRAVVFVVAGVAAILSYSHIVELAIAAGAGWRAYILPLSLDGLVAACTYTLVAGGKGRWLAWAGIATGLVGSVAANVIAVRPDLVDLEIVAAVLAGFPPVALAVSAHLLVRTAAAR